MEDKDIAKTAVEVLLRKLPAPLQGVIEPAWEKGLNEQPEFFSKPSKGYKHHRVKLLPTLRERKPRGFWSKSRCFYEIGVGEYDTMDRCRVRFLMAGNQAVCSSGKYNRAVNDILRTVKRDGTSFTHIPAADGTYTEFYLLRRVPDPEQIADDMIWIIEHTFREFQRIPDA